MLLTGQQTRVVDSRYHYRPWNQH